MGSGQSELGGFRIFKVNPQSPASEGGLEVFFDFILEVNGEKMDCDQKSFFEKIQASENNATKLMVYNIRSHTVRDVYVTPRQWGGAGLLGATVRYDTIDNSENQGIRVLEVFPNSPAAHAGLMPYKDYLLGTADVMFRDLDELVELVNASLNKRLQIYVYNSDSETIREVYIAPNHSWGGEGIIGCDIGTGLLHRIPAPRRPVSGMASGAAADTSGGAAVAAVPPPGMAPEGVAAAPPLPPQAPGQAAWPPGTAPAQIDTAASAPGGPLPAVTPQLPAQPWPQPQPGVAPSPTAIQAQLTQAAAGLNDQSPAQAGTTSPMHFTADTGAAQLHAPPTTPVTPMTQTSLQMDPSVPLVTPSPVLPPAPPPADSLPPGWAAQLEPTSGRTYYYNQSTGQSQWEMPVAQVDGPGVIYQTGQAM